MKERTTGLPRSLPWWLHLHGAISAAFLLLPVLTLIAFSFSRSPSALKWGGFTFHWYLQLAGNGRLLRAAENSAIIAAAATAIGLLLGIPAAIGHARLHRSRHTVAATLTLPLMAPDIVAALSLKLWCVTLFSMAPGLPPMILGHSLLAIAYTFLLVSSRLQRFDWNLTDAARDLGASPWATFHTFSSLTSGPPSPGPPCFPSVSPSTNTSSATSSPARAPVPSPSKPPA